MLLQGQRHDCAQHGDNAVFVTTDAAINSNLLSQALAEVVSDTFNMVSVDGDTSTNDMVIVLANGAAGSSINYNKNDDYTKFVEALRALRIKICRALVADGEVATKLLECRVTGAKTKKDAKLAAKAVVNSSLLKAAMFGADANWGRVLCALGYSGADLDVGGVAVSFLSAGGSVKVCQNGAGIDFDERLAKAVLTQKEITISVTLQDGDESATAWGCDLTYDYVKIKVITEADGFWEDNMTIHTFDRTQVLTQALPYIKQYSGKTVVIKYGGNAMVNEELKSAVMEDIVLLSTVGIKVVLVHGGGPEINDMLLKSATAIIGGMRYTDEETMEIVQMVLAGKVRDWFSV